MSTRFNTVHPGRAPLPGPPRFTTVVLTCQKPPERPPVHPGPSGIIPVHQASSRSITVALRFNPRYSPVHPGPWTGVNRGVPGAQWDWGIKNACHKKNRLYKQFLCSGSHTCEEKYKTYKNKLTSILRTAEKEYYSKLLTDAKGNIKSTWKILNTIINKKTNISKLPSHFECNEINIVSKQSIADGFNNFFVDVGSNLDKKITVADNAASIMYI